MNVEIAPYYLQHMKSVLTEFTLPALEYTAMIQLVQFYLREALDHLHRLNSYGFNGFWSASYNFSLYIYIYIYNGRIERSHHTSWKEIYFEIIIIFTQAYILERLLTKYRIINEINILIDL